MKQLSCMWWVLLGLGCSTSQDDGASDAVDTDDSPGPSPVAQCDAAAIGGEQVIDLTVGDMERQYRVVIPDADAGVELPVVMAFHGGDGRNYPFPQEQRFNSLAAEQQFIMVYPLAELVPPNEGEWILNTDNISRHDIDYVQAILADLASGYCVDFDRVYATGYSLGSMFTYEVACQLNDQFAAVASFAGTMPVSPASCDLTNTIAVMHLHGADDFLIPYGDTWEWKEWDDVGEMRDIPGLIDFWATQNSCQNTTDDAGGGVRHIVHSECSSDVRVEHYRINGVGHDWPAEIRGTSTHQVIWDFVSSFSK